MSFWTDERTEFLRKHWGKGVSASQIANRLGGGCTKSAVIGKANRLGLKSLTGREFKPGAGRSGHRKPHRKPVERRQPITPRFVSEPLPQTRESHVPFDQRVNSIIDIADDQCRYIFGDSNDAHFCDRKQLLGLPYCAEHQALCTVQIEPRRKRTRSYAYHSNKLRRRVYA